MLHISTENVPPLQLLKDTINELMEVGVAIGDATELKKRLTEDSLNARRTLSNNYGIDNPNSPAQVVAALKSLNDPVIDTCCSVVTYKGGKKIEKYSSNASVLKKLNNIGYDISKQLTVYRRATKYLGYVDMFIRERDTRGRVHPKVSYGITNRINYSDPPLMNIPKLILWDLVQPRIKGNKLFSIDIKNQEPWLLINMLNITDLKYYLTENSSGLYLEIFRDWFGCEPTKEELVVFKACWNALTYGGSKKLILQSCDTLDGDYIYKCFKEILELKEYQKECTAKGFAGKREIETLFGTLLYCDAPKGMALARQIMDVKMQGTGVDVLAFLVENFLEKVDDAGYTGLFTLYYTRHDELIIEVDLGLFEMLGIEKVVRFMRDCFEHTIDDWEPFRVEVKEVKATEFQYMDDPEEESII